MKKTPISLTAEEILNDPMINKGSAFTFEERSELGLHGYLPYHIFTIEEQLERRYQNFCEQPSDLAKYIFLAGIQNRNEIAFYRLISEHLEEMLPLIYTPTIGEVSLHYSTLYRHHRGVYIPYPLQERMEEIIANIARSEVDVVVVTDGERVLGLGDLGAGGMAISVGKTTLYTLLGGIHPSRTLPILLDVGTNNPKLLQDPLYIGWRNPRIAGKAYDDFVERFVLGIKKRYPKVLLQWEDFGKSHARPLLSRYRKKICSFNDDIQGTAAVVLAGILSALQIEKKKLSKQKIVILGGGSAGIGIADYLLLAMQEEGLSVEDALENLFIVDIAGLLHSEMSSLDAGQKRYAKQKSLSLKELIEEIHPAILIGVSGQGGAFSEEIIKTMARYVKRPIIFPLSNPTQHAEATPLDLLFWTEGKAIIATGSPFAPVRYGEKDYVISQCNNLYIFPGIGLGAIVAGANEVSDAMLLAASRALASASANGESGLLPPLNELRAICRQVALAVAKCVSNESEQILQEKIDQTMWYPEYPTYCRKERARS